MATESFPLVSSTAGVSDNDELESTHGARMPLVGRFLTDVEIESSQKTSRAKGAVETAAQAPRPKRRFPHLMPITEAPTQDFGLLEKWDGVVLAVQEDKFTARLYRADESIHSTQAVFSVNELSPEERNQIEEGASFVWTIGYRHVGATRHRDSVIYFRRLAPWETEELRAAELRGAELKNTIGWR